MQQISVGECAHTDQSISVFVVCKWVCLSRVYTYLLCIYTAVTFNIEPVFYCTS